MKYFLVNGDMGDAQQRGRPMSDTCVLIGKQLRYGAEQCGRDTYDVDLTMYTLDEISHPIVKAMIDEYRPTYTFQLDSTTRIVTVRWRPAQARPGKNHDPTARLTNRRS